MGTYYNSVKLLVCCLHLLPREFAASFTCHLDDGSLDRALQEGIKQGLFPEWFTRNFHYDALDGRLVGLRNCLKDAYLWGWVRLDGTMYQYHMDRLSKDEFMRFLRDVSVSDLEAMYMGCALGAFLKGGLPAGSAPS